MNRAVIFSNGNLSKIEPAKSLIKKGDYIICADGGWNYAKKLNLTPDVVIGDFDSYPIGKNFHNNKTEIMKFPAKKDKTDFELAVNLAISKKYEKILIFGIFGDRIDHLMANFLYLSKVQKENKRVSVTIT